MSTNESTGDKLLASVRKTKGAATTTSKSPKKKVVKKAPMTVKKKSVVENRAKTATDPKKPIIDLFQSGRRVWPD